VWCKSSAYQSRLVREPRKVLSELAVVLADEVGVRVWNSVSEIRYLVMPERPKNTEHLSETELTALISRDHMIGAARDIELNG
jgi:nitrile hydratase